MINKRRTGKIERDTIFSRQSIISDPVATWYGSHAITVRDTAAP